MNILIGKLGQKIIFNRNSDLANRSNTNGNVGAFLFFTMLAANNPYDTFYMIGENDLSTFKKHFYPNIIDVSKCSIKEIEEIGLDFGIFNIGMLEEQNPDSLAIEYLNVTGLKWLLAADDPRCLITKAKDIYNAPRIILSQTQGLVDFVDDFRFVLYMGIEKANAYDRKLSHYYKNKDFVIVANAAGSYDRISIIQEFIKDIDDVEVYGRVDAELVAANSKFKGEVNFNDIQHIMDHTKITFLVPVKKGWVTAKYIEVLLNGALPIFHVDYDTELLRTFPFDLIDVVENATQLKAKVQYYLDNENERAAKVEMLRKLLVEPYLDGKILSNQIISLADKM